MNVTIAITVYDEYAGFTIRTVEVASVDRQGDSSSHGRYVAIPRPWLPAPMGPAVCAVYPSGRVATYPKLRHRLGVGCITGEGVRLVSSDRAASS